jgi:hypothetical protein
MKLDWEQQRQVDRLAGKGQELASAKQAARDATREVKAAVREALDAGVPVSRCAGAARVQRSLIYHWFPDLAENA